jgi:hypothetical protein
VTRDPVKPADELDSEVIHVPCPLDTCRAAPDEKCKNWITGRPLIVSHWQRVRAAQGKDQL